MIAPNTLLIDKIIDTALAEDLGPGDLTTEALIDPSIKGKARLVPREEMVLAGIEVFGRVLSRLDPDIALEWNFQDGDVVPAGRDIGVVEGSLRGILSAERTALNFLQHLSGIATLTKRYVDKAGPSKVRVVDTRKTTPGLRILEKYAVRVGGAHNHRLGLFDGVLIKDNHIAAAGSISRAVEKIRANVPHTVKIEVEVDDLRGLEEAMRVGADAVLLDNMSIDEMKEAVSIAGGRVLLEASGGITLETIGEVAQTGVDLISVGALTHSARSVDISLEIIEQ
ncbi:MAG TPA: carboxylating nicotinate-nucleotide diphosphorylase [Desulfatiglandales bacterium]|nr:carboxylating nicotinate-nucleotide diphosphorylase [Desulfatiglandales bacterium]